MLHHRKIRNWHAQPEPRVYEYADIAPFVKQEICHGIYWVTDRCPIGVKDGFRPRVVYAHMLGPQCPTPKPLTTADRIHNRIHVWREAWRAVHPERSLTHAFYTHR